MVIPCTFKTYNLCARGCQLSVGLWASFSERSYFNSIINIHSCYCLSNYMCEGEKTFFVTGPHKTRIKLDRAAKLIKYLIMGFPCSTFISLRLHWEKVFQTKETTIVKVKLENLSCGIFTFLVIVVVTSMKVAQYLGNLQLTTTLASHIYVNPEIPDATSMAAEFVIRDDQSPVLKIQYQKSNNIEVEMQRNRFTLTELVSQNPDRYRYRIFMNKYPHCTECRYDTWLGQM